jgi:parallel beta-helix repeat protein
VNISGFTIEDASFGCGILLTGVNLTGVNNCSISTNIVSGNSQGIYLTNSIQNIIANNTVKNNRASGISLMGSSDNRITDNIASNHVNYHAITRFVITSQTLTISMVLDFGNQVTRT